MTASVWHPNPKTVTQANVNGTFKTELFFATDQQRIFDIDTFAYASGTGSLVVFVDGKVLARNMDYVETTDTQFVLADPCTAGQQVLAVGFVGVTGSQIVDNILRADLIASSGAGVVSFTQGLAGAVTRSLLARMKDTICVKDFGAVGDGVNDDTAAINAAIATANVFANTIYFPPGNYRITNSITLTRGVVLKGASKYGSYFTTPAASTFTMLRIAAQQCMVKGFCFKPTTAAQMAILVYAGRATITDNYFLAPINNSGTAITLTDINPDTAAFVAGAYSHTISENIIGDGGFAFAYGIDETSTVGITSCKFRANRIFSNRPIRISRGGANTYSENLLQSSTQGPTGVGISLGANTNGEKIWGNYFEKFQAMIETLNVSSANQLFHAVGNHNDNNTTTVSDAGVKNYVFEDSKSLVENRNGWSTQYGSTTTWLFKTPTAITALSVNTSGNVGLGGTASTAHVINRNSSTEADVLLNIQYNGSSMGYFQDARTGVINGGATALALNKNTSTNRSLNLAGTSNAGGIDYAEYMLKSLTCGIIAKGQVVGIDVNGHLTDKFAEAFSFVTKTTNPSYVGGDTWADEAGTRPFFDHIEGEAEEATAVRKEAFDVMFAAWEAKVEELRQRVDRIAFCGQIPVNLYEFEVGDYIVPVVADDGIGIKVVAIPEADIYTNMRNYVRAIGRVITKLPDGRPLVIVKIS